MPVRPFTLQNSLRVVLAIGWSDFVLKYRGSILGYLWSLALPLTKFGVILFAFGPYLKNTIPMYSLYLFLGIIIWEHFSVTTTGCMNMLIEKAPIIQRVPFPKTLLIFAVGWTNIIVFLTQLIVFMFYALMIGWKPSLNVLYLIITMIDMTLIALGIGMFLASWCLKFRDIQHLWTIILQILFWVTPVMLPFTLQKSALETVSDVLKGGSASPTAVVKLFMEVQPLSMLMLDARRAVLYPDAWGMPTLMHTMAFFLISLLLFLAGLVMFRRRQHLFIQEY
jgi:ABC-2 type transport system permease protein